MDDLWLRPVRLADEAAVRAAQQAMAADDFVFALFLDQAASWADWVRNEDAFVAGTAPSTPDRVPAVFLLAVVGDEIVGRTSIRFELNDWLRERGGHIGYGVLPQFRRRGYARQILAQSLVIVRARGLDPVLLTCDDDNAASIATIEGAGGRPDRERPTLDVDGQLIRRYWIAAST